MFQLLWYYIIVSHWTYKKKRHFRIFLPYINQKELYNIFHNENLQFHDKKKYILYIISIKKKIKNKVLLFPFCLYIYNGYSPPH